MKHTKSEELYKEAVKYIPGGVNSPVRSFNSVGISPIFAKKAHGSRITDVDDNEYIDYICSWGPLMLGHSNEEISRGIGEMIASGTSFGLATEIEVEMAKLIVDAYPAIDQVRMVNSGTEATMSAIKLARGYTKKNKIIKFAGCYHGHFDGFLIEAGSGVLTEGIPGSLGVPKDSIKNTLIGSYNNLDSIKELFNKYGDDIAGIILEPVAGNMGVIKANREFIEGLRELCDEYGSLLIFDEVMSGFRVAFKGAQSLYNVKPDLVTYAKIMGGGLPCGAYGGKKEIMEHLAPLGGVYQAGTMSGNPIVMGAGLATLNILKEGKEKLYNHIEKIGSMLEEGMLKIAKKNNIPMVINRVGGMMTIFFTREKEVNTYEDVKTCDLDMFKKYFKHMLNNNIYLPPSQFEALFLSTEHTEEHIDKFLQAFESFKA